MWGFTTKVVPFMLGTAGAIYEIFIRDGPERPFTLALIGALLGTPFLAMADELLRKGKV